MVFSRSDRLLALALTCAFLSVPLSAQSVGEVFASDASVKGSVLLAGGGTQVMSGSTVSAGKSAASLKLSRGGEVRVCPGTSISVSTSQSGRDLMMGLSSGALETHYTLAGSSDTILTPDFRILLAGPGTFHFAVSSDPAGNACVRSLAAGSASLIVSEMMGDGSYQVKAGDELVFHNGHVANPGNLAPPDCGCPATAPPIERARIEPPPPVPAATTPAEAPQVPQLPAAVGDVTTPLPALKAEDVHVQVDAPFVFRGAEPEPVLPYTFARISLNSLPEVATLEPEILPPPAPPELRPVAAQSVGPAPKPQKKGFFGKVKAFFASVFRG